MLTVHLSDSISLEDVRSWYAKPGETLIFEISRQSSFQQLSEGLAIARLAFLKRSGVEIATQLTFPFENKEEEFVRLYNGILGSLFGLALVLAARVVRDGGGNELESRLIKTRLWSRAKDSFGVVGDGKRRYFVSRDPDYLLPEGLARPPIKEFPDRERFRYLFNMAAKEWLGMERFGTASTDEDIITAVYEATKNSYDHALTDEKQHGVTGIRGFFIEKIKFYKSESIEKRGDLPLMLKKYLERIRPLLQSSENILFALTIADLGPGIQGTLPKLEEESDWQCLNRAFRRGVTRKPVSSDIGLGQGLFKVIESGEHLGAFLFIGSGNLLGYRDFSDPQNQPLPHDLLSKWPSGNEQEHCNLGTILSMVFPLYPGGSDQSRLF